MLCTVMQVDMTKARTDWKTDLRMDWLDFIEKLYFTIIQMQQANIA